MSEDRDTAQYFASYRGQNGKNGGPALVVVDIWNSRWKVLLGLGAVDSAPISGLGGHTQVFVPVYLLRLFSIMKTRFSAAFLD